MIHSTTECLLYGMLELLKDRYYHNHTSNWMSALYHRDEYMENQPNFKVISKALLLYTKILFFATFTYILPFVLEINRMNNVYNTINCRAVCKEQ